MPNLRDGIIPGKHLSLLNLRDGTEIPHYIVESIQCIVTLSHPIIH